MSIYFFLLQVKNERTFRYDFKFCLSWSKTDDNLDGNLDFLICCQKAIDRFGKTLKNS